MCSSSSTAPREGELVGRIDASLQHSLDLAEGVRVVFGRVGHDAVRRRIDAQSAHVGVVGGEQHTDIAGDAGDDDARDLEMESSVSSVVS